MALKKGDGQNDVKGWVDELTKGGMTKSDAKTGIERTLSAVREEIKGQEKTLKRAATEETRKGAVDMTSKPAKQLEVETQKVYIMCMVNEWR